MNVVTCIEENMFEINTCKILFSSQNKAYDYTIYYHHVPNTSMKHPANNKKIKHTILLTNTQLVSGSRCMFGVTVRFERKGLDMA